MAVDDILRGILAADKATLNRVARVLRGDDEAAARPAADTAEARLVTQREAARRLGISATTVWRLIKDGSLAVVAVRGKQRVRLDSVMRYAGVAV